MSHGGSYSVGGDRLAKFAAQGRLKPYVSNELLERTASPVKFRTPRGSPAYGYEATVLADLCDAILAARADGVLQKQQVHIAQQAEVLVRGFARVGIIALVDEATGYPPLASLPAEVVMDYLDQMRALWPSREPDGWAAGVGNVLAAPEARLILAEAQAAYLRGEVLEPDVHRRMLDAYDRWCKDGAKPTPPAPAP